MKMKFILLLLTIFLASCGTAYQKYTWSGGYKDTRVGSNKYLVEYHGNGTLSPEIVEAYWEQRANEVCRNGFTYLVGEEGKNNGGVFVSPVVAIDHPWKEAVIECK